MKRVSRNFISYKSFFIHIFSFHRETQQIHLRITSTATLQCVRGRWPLDYRKEKGVLAVFVEVEEGGGCNEVMLMFLSIFQKLPIKYLGYLLITFSNFLQGCFCFFCCLILFIDASFYPADEPGNLEKRLAHRSNAALEELINRYAELFQWAEWGGRAAVLMT